MYAFGVCLWEMATRAIPYGPMDVWTIQLRVAAEGLRPTVDTEAPESPFHRSQPTSALLPLIEVNVHANFDTPTMASDDCELRRPCLWGPKVSWHCDPSRRV